MEHGAIATDDAAANKHRPAANHGFKLLIKVHHFETREGAQGHIRLSPRCHSMCGLLSRRLGGIRLLAAQGGLVRTPGGPPFLAPLLIG